LALKLGIQTYQILTNDDEVCIPSLSSILLAVTLFPGGQARNRNTTTGLMKAFVGGKKKSLLHPISTVTN